MAWASNERFMPLRREVEKNRKFQDLSVVIVSYNVMDYVEACLSSIKENLSSSAVETIVIDNASTDGSPDMIRENFPWAKLIKNHRNLGYSRANNQGIKEAEGEFILLLNPDTVILPNAINILQNELRNDPTIGAVGPLLFSSENRFQVSFGMEISFFHEFLQKSVLNNYFRRKLKKMKEKREVGWLSGACLLTRKSILEKAGLFDEDFFLYFEDIDLCRRIRKRGRKLILVPEAKVYHAEGGSAAKLKKSSLYHYRKSQLLYYKKHGSWLSIFLLRFYLRINFALLYAANFFKSSEERDFVWSLFQLLKENEEN
jgi:N-acetylglucosaminyl-diphospho-decaprenol L-rhamnosyltransferase